MTKLTPSVPCAVKPRVVIHYCSLCNWMLRSAWLAQELLQSFSTDLEEVSLRPGSGGIFEIWVDDTLLWERKRDGGFPEAKVLKCRLRDQIWPERDLGHNESSPTKEGKEGKS